MASIWSEGCAIPPRPALRRDFKAEVVVIGGGMAGILTAYQLQQAGKQVVVLEAERIASGQTQNTTAKVTAQHGMIFGKLTKTMGEERARQYAAANQGAVEEYRQVIAREAIDCDWENKAAYLYSDSLEQLILEEKAAKKLGLPVSLERQVPIPIPAAGAVRMEGQGQFNPLKFIRAVSSRLTVYEHTQVERVEGSRLETTIGDVEAEQIVFATHFPFRNVPGLYFARMHQERSYVLALAGAEAVDGMFIGAGKERWSLRSYGNLLLFGGEGHRAGKNRMGGRYDALRQKARLLFPGSREVAAWSAQDCMTLDSVPYIGRYSAGKPNWYVATGFQKWGMTHSMAAAMIIRDSICGRENPNAQVFAPGRFGAEDVLPLARESGQAAKGLTKNLFFIPAAKAEKIPRGHGGVVFMEGKKVGVYRDGDGTLYPVDIRCPHLGCQLEWNPDEKSWDCPCHGSRFDIHGRLISGPAQKDITGN